MNKEIRSESAPSPAGPYSQAVETPDGVYCSGQLGTDRATGKLEDGIQAQTRRALSNLASVLGVAGLDMKSVVKTTVFMVDMGQFALMNEEYAKHFTAPFPARSTVQVTALAKGALVEIDAIAVKK